MKRVTILGLVFIVFLGVQGNVLRASETCSESTGPCSGPGKLHIDFGEVATDSGGCSIYANWFAYTSWGGFLSQPPGNSICIGLPNSVQQNGGYIVLQLYIRFTCSGQTFEVNSWSTVEIPPASTTQNFHVSATGSGGA